MVGIVQNNPLFALQFGIAVNSVMIVFMLFSNASTYNILFLLTASFVFKVIPWFTIRNTTIKTSDIVATFGIAFMYLGWILWENKTREVMNRFLRCLNLKR
jgi:hypothetical protein